MKIKPVSSKKKLLYSVGVLCASLSSCDDNMPGRQGVPGIVPNDNPPAQPKEAPQQLGGYMAPIPGTKETPQLLGGDVPHIPASEDEPVQQNN